MITKIISVRVIPNSSRNQIGQLENGTLKVKLTCAPVDGKANEALRTVLAKQFDVPKRCIHILRGHTSKNKIVEIKKER